MCPGCGNHHEELVKTFIVVDGDDLYHQKCWEKELREIGA